MNPKVYIFRGAPASGKGTVTPQFAKLLPKPVVLIEQDKLRWGFHLIGRKISEIGPEEHKLAYENTVLLYERYLQAGVYTIVVEGLFTWDDKGSSEGASLQLVDLAKQYGFEVKSIVLIADKQELYDRNVKRQYAVPKDEFEALYHAVYAKIDSSELVIDSTGKSVDEVVKALEHIA